MVRYQRMMHPFSTQLFRRADLPLGYPLHGNPRRFHVLKPVSGASTGGLRPGPATRQCETISARLPRQRTYAECGRKKHNRAKTRLHTVVRAALPTRRDRMSKTMNYHNVKFTAAYGTL